MKKTFILIMVCLTVFIGCAPLTPQPQKTGSTGVGYSKKQYYIDLKRTVEERGYITVDELEALNFLRIFQSCRNVRDYSPYIKELFDVLNTVIEKDLLPFRAMLYLALERENYDEAEIIRLSWLSFLEQEAYDCKGTTYFVSASTSSRKSESLCSETTKIKISQQIRKLTTVVGLTDPMLITLRKELMSALNAKKWDDAQKIQAILTARVNELSPPPQVVQTPGGQTTIIVPQESSTKHVTVEQIPRYGATDVGRAVSLITRGSSALTPKEAGTLGIFDILLKR